MNKDDVFWTIGFLVTNGGVLYGIYWVFSHYAHWGVCK